MAGLVCRGRSREQVIDANWKIVVENFLECYHCPVAHKSFSKLIDVDPDAHTPHDGALELEPVQATAGGRRASVPEGRQYRCRCSATRGLGGSAAWLSPSFTSVSGSAWSACPKPPRLGREGHRASGAAARARRP